MLGNRCGGIACGGGFPVILLLPCQKIRLTASASEDCAPQSVTKQVRTQTQHATLISGQDSCSFILPLRLSFANVTLRALDSDPWVERYAWFAERWPYGRPFSTNPSSDLLQPGASSALTALGSLYTSAVG